MLGILCWAYTVGLCPGIVISLASIITGNSGGGGGGGGDWCDYGVSCVCMYVCMSVSW